MSEIEEQIDELVTEAKKPGVFNIVDVVKERAFPKQVVNVYVDESIAYETSKLKEELSKTDAAAKEYVEIQAKIDAKLDELLQSKYEFHLTGISEGQRDKLHAECIEKFPIEYSEDKNLFTNEVKRVEIQSDERDEVFTNLLWAAHVEKIVSPDGAVQVGLSVDDAKTLRSGLPLAASSGINDAIDKLRIATSVFLLKVDEDFLAKS